MAEVLAVPQRVQCDSAGPFYAGMECASWCVLPHTVRPLNRGFKGLEQAGASANAKTFLRSQHRGTQSARSLRPCLRGDDPPFTHWDETEPQHPPARGSVASCLPRGAD